MMWIGLVAGIILGALIWGLEGAVTLGFIGWITGLIIQSNRKAAKAASVVAPQKTGVRAGSDPNFRLGSNAEDLEVRVARLEHSVSMLQAQLVRMGVSPVIPDAAPAAMVRDPISR